MLGLYSQSVLKMMAHALLLALSKETQSQKILTQITLQHCRAVMMSVILEDPAFGCLPSCSGFRASASACVPMSPSWDQQPSHPCWGMSPSALPQPAQPWGPAGLQPLGIFQSASGSWTKLVGKAFSQLHPGNPDLLTPSCHWARSYSPGVFRGAGSCQVMDRWRYWNKGKFIGVWGSLLIFWINLLQLG